MKEPIRFQLLDWETGEPMQVHRAYAADLRPETLEATRRRVEMNYACRAVVIDFDLLARRAQRARLQGR